MMFRNIFVIAQWILLYYSISFFNIIQVTTLANVMPLFTLIMAKFAFKKKITWQKVIALTIVIISIFYLHF